MARVTGFLENMTGRLGNIVIVHRGNKTFIQSKPGKREKKPTPGQARAMDIFSLTGKIARSIASVDELKFLWPPTKWNNHSTYNRLFKANYNHLDIEDLSGYVRLTDNFGFELIEPSIKLGKSDITIEAEISAKNGLDNKKELKYVIATGIIILKNPKGKFRPKYEVLPFKTGKELFSSAKRTTFICPFEGTVLEKFEGYTAKKVFAVLLLLDKEGNPLGNAFGYSKTFSN